jgi:hypothetical protein
MKPTARELELRAMREAQFAQGGRRKAKPAVTPQRVTHAATVPNAVPNKDRVKKWKADHADRYRSYMRDYMRRRRGTDDGARP